METAGAAALPDPVRTALTALGERRRSAVVLVGPSGSGKTHVLREVVGEMSSARHVSTRAPVLATAALRPHAIRALLDPGTTSGPAVRRVLAVDDLDRWSPGLLHLLSDAVDSRRAALLATVRSSSLDKLLSRFRPAEVPVLVELGPWRVAELVAHARAVLDGPLHPVDGAALLRFSSGNPLCVVELLEHGRRSGRLRRRHDVWRCTEPLAVPPVTAARTWATLVAEPPAVLDVLTTLATAEPLPLHVLVRVHTLAAVTTAEDRGWLLTMPRGAEVEVRLARHLDGQVATAAASTLRRRSLRAALVDALVVEQHDGAALVDAVAACLTTGVDLPQDLRTTAASRALRRHRPDVAATLTGGLPDPAAVELRTLALAEQGWFVEAARTLRAQPASGRPVSTAPARSAWADALDSICGGTAHAHEPRAVHGGGATHDLLPGLCADAWSGHRLEATVAAGRAALTSGRLTERSRLLCLVATCWACLQLGRTAEVLELASGGLLPGAGDEPVPTCLLTFSLGLACLVRGALQDAAAHGARLCRQGVDEGWHLAYGLGALLRGCVAAVGARPTAARGRLGESAASLADAVPAVDRSGLRLGLALVQRMASGTQGEDEDGDDPAATPAPRLLAELARLLEAETLLLADERRAALEVAGSVADRARHEGWTLVLLQALHLLVRVDATRAVAEEIAEVAGATDFELAARYAAHAAAAWTRDRPALTELSEHYEASGMRWLAAETAATALAGAERSHLTAAWAPRAKRVLHRLRQDDDVCPPGWWGAASVRVARVTPRELEIAEAVVRGETSSQIAERLCLSRRTVENHLQHIYRKLGVSRRDDLELAYGTVVPRVPRHGT